MDIQTLDKQKMDAVRELAEIHMQISAGNGKLMELKTSTDEYIKEREKLASEAVEKTLDAVRSTALEVEKYAEEVTRYRRGVQETAETLSQWANSLTELAKTTKEWSENERKSLDEREKSLQIIQNSVKADLALVKAERAQSLKDLELIRSEKREVESKQQALKEAFAVAKAKKII